MQDAFFKCNSEMALCKRTQHNVWLFSCFVIKQERNSTDKKLIALALLCIYIAGDNELRKAYENRISNNGYSKFINDILTII